jgi:hypothetical protein
MRTDANFWLSKSPANNRLKVMDFNSGDVRYASITIASEYIHAEDPMSTGSSCTLLFSSVESIDALIKELQECKDRLQPQESLLSSEV